MRRILWKGGVLSERERGGDQGDGSDAHQLAASVLGKEGGSERGQDFLLTQPAVLCVEQVMCSRRVLILCGAVLKVGVQYLVRCQVCSELSKEAVCQWICGPGPLASGCYKLKMIR